MRPYYLLIVVVMRLSHVAHLNLLLWQLCDVTQERRKADKDLEWTSRAIGVRRYICDAFVNDFVLFELWRRAKADASRLAAILAQEDNRLRFGSRLLLQEGSRGVDRCSSWGDAGDVDPRQQSQCHSTIKLDDAFDYEPWVHATETELRLKEQGDCAQIRDGAHCLSP